MPVHIDAPQKIAEKCNLALAVEQNVFGPEAGIVDTFLVCGIRMSKSAMGR
jgi:hypothetical protein